MEQLRRPIEWVCEHTIPHEPEPGESTTVWLGCFRIGWADNWYAVGFVVSLAYVSLLAELILDSAKFACDAIGMSDDLEGVTVLAWGAQVPDCLASVALAKKGLGPGAVANADGSPGIRGAGRWRIQTPLEKQRRKAAARARRRQLMTSSYKVVSTQPHATGDRSAQRAREERPRSPGLPQLPTMEEFNALYSQMRPQLEQQQQGQEPTAGERRGANGLPESETGTAHLRTRGVHWSGSVKSSPVRKAKTRGAKATKPKEGKRGGDASHPLFCRSTCLPSVHDFVR